jgi:uncharacterized membrane protein YjgN (DUF898 family)
MNEPGKQCPKCGLIQSPALRCKICGTLMRSPTFLFESPKPSSSHPSPSDEPMDIDVFLREESPSPEAISFVDNPEDLGPAYRLTFHGSGGALFGIYVRNLFFTFITLGVYYFWGKAKVRGYLIGNTEFLGDRLAFHGTGRELLAGSGKAFFIFALPLALLNSLPGLLKLGPIFEIGAQGLTSLAVLILIPFAMVTSFRYRLTRTSWREIRFSFWGKSSEFMRIFLGGLILTVFTLGLYYPFFLANNYAFMVSHTHFGNHSFKFTGHGRDLYGAFLRALALTIPTLGLCWFWFSARKQCYFWERTAFGKTQFRSTVTGKGLLRLNLFNLLLLIGTAGLAWPWVKIQRTRYILENLLILGPLELDAIQQAPQASTATGEGLAGFLNADFNLGS